MDATLILREKKIGLGRLPAIVHPKPIFRCDANLLFDDLIYLGSERCNGGVRLGRIEAIGENHAPTRRTRRVNAGGDQCCSGPLGKQGRQGRSGRQLSKEGCPQSVIASMLVGQNTNAAAGTQQIDHWLKSLLAIEQFQAGLATCSAHVRVNEAITKLLVDARIAHVTDEIRHQLREQFPCSEMTQNEHYGNAGAKFPIHRLDIVNLDPLQDFRRRHCSEFDATEQISAESSEMATDEPTHFLPGLFIGKRNGNVAFCQASIFPGQEPCTKTEELPEHKENRQW